MNSVEELKRMVMGEQRKFEISFIYNVSVDEEGLYQNRSDITDTDREDAKQLLRVALQQEDVANYLMVREIAFDLTDIGSGEEMPEVLTGHGIDDHTPVLPVLDQLPEEKRQEFLDDDGAYLVEVLEDTLKVTLDHVHVRRLQAHEHAPASEAKQRHHKQKPGKKNRNRKG